MSASSKINADLVSVIIPVYNAENFIAETIQSVLNQTYTNWELWLIDDCSTDKSIDVITPYLKDSRINLIKNKRNLHAALTRNKGITAANGRYIAFLDADDIWLPQKLEKQIDFMNIKGSAFSFTSYEFADKDAKPKGKIVHVPATITYKQALKNTTIWTSTVIFDMTKLSKNQVYMPNLQRGQDTATWWQVLKSIDFANGLDDALSIYRRTPTSLSANKIQALLRTWRLYRDVEHLNLLAAGHSFVHYVLRAVRRRA